jgi:hypothetical protein
MISYLPLEELMRRFVLGSLVMMLLWAPTAFPQAQATTGTLQGFVRDESGAVVPGVQISIRNSETGQTRQSTTDSTGYYRTGSLPSGTYELTAIQPGFGTTRQTGILVSLGQALDVDLTLKVAGTTGEVTVEATSPLIELTKTDVSTIVNQRAIEELPINGRRFTDFVLLTPGVTQDPRGLSGASNGDLSFGGLRGINNNLQIDGVDNNNAFFAQSRGRYRAPYNFSQAAVKEFQVVNSNFSAEFGKAAGAVINVVTKSGGNELHGEGFYFLRDSGIAARHAFAARQYKSRQQQFGGAAGGPVIRDKLFYFGNYDQQIFRVPTNVRLTGVPAADANSPDPAIQRAIALLRGFEGDFKSELLANVFLAKTDWILNGNNTVSARYNYQRLGGLNNVFFNLISPVTTFALDTNSTGKVRTDSAVASLTTIVSSNSVNELRFQFSRDNQENIANGTLPNVAITNVISGFGRGTTEPRATREKRVQIVDNFSWNHLRHELKTGIDMSVLRIENFFPGFFGGAYSYSSISNFVNNSPTTYQQAFGDPYTHPNAMQYAGFMQDNWRARQNLNLNFGLRYELETYATSELQANPLYPNTGRIPVDKNNVAPRFGFSWSPKSARAVMHGGYGIFYGRTAQVITATAISGNGLRSQRYLLSSSVPAQAAAMPVYPATLKAPPAITATGTNIFVFDPNFVNPYVQQGSLELERQIRDDFKVAVSYIMTKGTHLNRSRDVNLFAPAPVTYPIFDAASNQIGTGVVQQFNTAARPVAGLGQINTFESSASSIYHGMFVSLNKRWSRGYQFMLSYTLSKAIDDGPDALIVTTPGRVQNAYDARAERALSVTDQRQRFVFSWTAEPAMKALSGLADAIVNGWKFSAISTITSGRPIDAQSSGDPNRDGNTGNDRTPGFGRNAFTGFGHNNHDLRVTRVFGRTEGRRFEFLAEFFNVFNHTNFLFGRNDDGFFRTHSTFSTTTARFTQTSPFPLANDAYSPRQIQFALKYLF